MAGNTETEARDMRRRGRDPIEGTHRIARVSWREARYRHTLLAQTVAGLITEAAIKGVDLTDLVITVTPDALPPGTIRIELHGVKA